MAMPRKQKMPYSIHEKRTWGPFSNSPPSRAESSSEALSRSSSSASDRYSNRDAISALRNKLVKFRFDIGVSARLSPSDSMDSENKSIRLCCELASTVTDTKRACNVLSHAR